jgi:hypothetical protein|tara:strand:+ start:441 stop:710 length:270 start_codon:yes stop_codon:yes gene_type:complete
MESTTDKRKFIASSDIFSDFTVEISLYDIESIDDIIKIFVKKLRECLLSNKFTNLVEMLDKKCFHIHGKTVEMILTSCDTESFFICDHA